MAFDIGGALRLLFLLLASPLAGILYYFVSESAGIQVLIFSTFSGVKVSSIESATKAVLITFYSEDLHPESWRVFSLCRRKCVVTANPKIMVEPFMKDFLGADLVLGTEIETYKGRATGIVKKPGVLVGNKRGDALVKAFGDEKPDIGLGDRTSDFAFMALCKEAYMVHSSSSTKPVTKDQLPKPVIFHDSRLVQKPNPIKALIILIWLPIGFLLSIIRVAAAVIIPMPFLFNVWRAIGIRITVKGQPPTKDKPSEVLFVCSHRTVIDALISSAVLGRQVPAVSYSVLRFIEFISPIKTARLYRDRTKDACIIKKLLLAGDLVICPEGTTSREPFLLRFSALFAELTDQLVPVAMVNHMSMFHGTTAGGLKAMDPFYFFMYPFPSYEVTFLGKVPIEVANFIQRTIASDLSYKCTNLTRKDKYKALAGNDGSVENMNKINRTLNTRLDKLVLI